MYCCSRTADHSHIHICIYCVRLFNSLAGVSRSSTVVVAYVMSVTGLDYRSALDSVRAARGCASPNFGFQRQLLAFQYDSVEKVSCGS